MKTPFADFAEHFNTIAADASNQFENIADDDLDGMVVSLKSAVVVLSAMLVHRIGGSMERASLEVRRARDLPASVLMRRFRGAIAAVNKNDQCNIPELAAVIAVIASEIEVAGIALERRRAGSLN